VATIVLDTRLFPLIVSRFPASWSEAELDAYLAGFVAIHDRGERFVHVSDITGTMAIPNPQLRKKAADFIAAEHDRSARLCMGTAQVAHALARGALTAIQWITPPPYPHIVVSGWPEALAWVRARAADSGLALPASIEQLRSER
jgi:hypothetical protein